MAKTHKDVEYEIDDAGGQTRTFKNPNEALSFTATIAIATGKSTLDVLVYSKAGARFHGGDDAVAQYEEDPEASVFERFEFKCNAVGRVP